MTVCVIDAAGRRRSPATLPGFHAGRPPRNKGMRYPADPPTVEEIIAVMRQAGDNRHGWRLRALTRSVRRIVARSTDSATSSPQAHSANGPETTTRHRPGRLRYRVDAGASVDDARAIAKDEHGH